MTRKKQPKYAVEQVVAVSRDKGQTEYCVIRAFELWQRKHGYAIKAHDTDWEWIPICNLRPLTAREIGPLAQRKRAGRRRGPR